MTARSLESETATRFCVLNTKEKKHKKNNENVQKTKTGNFHAHFHKL